MAQITARPVWLPVLYESDSEQVTLLGSPPLVAKGAESRFYISIFKSTGTRTPEDPGEVFDISNFVAFILKVWADGYGSGTLLLDTSDAAAITAGATVSYNYNATAEQFFNREAAQIEIYLPASVTANVTAGTRYGVLTGATAEAAAQPDYFGVFSYTSKEVGLGTAAAPPAPAAEYVRSDVFAAAINGLVRYGTNPPGRYPIIVNDAGTHGTALRTGTEGEWIEEQIANP